MNLKYSRLMSLATSILVIGSSLVGIGATAANAAATPVNVTFESDDTSGYKLGDTDTTSTVDFGGNVSSVVTSTSGANTSKVGQIVNGNLCYSGTTFLKLPVGNQLISASSYLVTMNLYSTVPLSKVKLKLEGGAGDPAREVDVAHTGSGWESLTFDFGAGPAVAPGNYRIASLFVGFTCDATHTTTGQTFLFDNVSFLGATVDSTPPPPPADTPSLFNFEGDGTTGYFDPFGGETASIENSSPTAGSVGSTKELKIVDNGWAPWAGVTFGWHDTTLISTANPVATANIYAPADGLPMMLKVENGGSGANKESAIVTSVQGWHRYSFTFTGFDPSINYNKTSIFVNFGSNSKTGQVWYVDDVAFAGAVSAKFVGEDTPSLFNFEGDGTTGYFDSFGGETASIVSTTPADGPIGSTKSLKIVDNGWAPWAGVTFGWHDTTLISTANPVATANIYAPADGLSIMLKVENGANGDLNKESAVVTSVKGWHKYSFTFTGFDPSVVYGKTAIFVNFGSNNKTGQVWYVDDVAFAGAVSAALPTPEVVVPKLINFEGAASNGYADPFGGPTVKVGYEFPAGGSVGSTRTLKILDNAWAPWGGVTFAWVDDSLLSKSQNVVTANIYAPEAGKTIKLKVENGADAGINTEVDVTSVQGWNKYSFVFTGNARGVKYNKASIFINFGASSRSGLAWYVDDVAFNGATGAALGGPASAPAVNYNVRLADWDASNSFDGTHVWGDGGLGSWFPSNTGYFAKYVKAGSTFTLRYKVTNATTGANAPDGTTLTLRLGAAYSGTNARFTVGGVVVNGRLPYNGEADIATKTVTVSGGYASVSITSNDVDGDSTDNPGTLSVDPNTLIPLFMQVKAEVDGNATTQGDWVNIIPTNSITSAPVITSISGTAGKKGQAIDIIGSNLGDAIGMTVTLFTPATAKTAAISTPVTVLAVSADGTRITVASPNSAQKGYFRVTHGGGTATSTTAFSSMTSVTAKPAITLATSLVKEVGGSLTLTGTNLGSSTSIAIGGVSAPFAVLSANSVSVTVPAGVTSGSTISATNAGGTFTTTKFVFQAGVITTITSSGKVGDTVTVTGKNLKASKVVFAGNKSAKILTNTGSTLTFTVPAGATSGAIVITTGAGTVTSQSFTVLPPAPTVASFTPTTGKKGTTLVSVKGTNLLGATVTVGSTQVTVAAGSTATLLKFVIPANASTGRITVTTAGGTVTTTASLTVTN